VCIYIHTRRCVVCRGADTLCARRYWPLALSLAYHYASSRETAKALCSHTTMYVKQYVCESLLSASTQCVSASTISLTYQYVRLSHTRPHPSLSSNPSRTHTHTEKQVHEDTLSLSFAHTRNGGRCVHVCVRHMESISVSTYICIYTCVCI